MELKPHPQANAGRSSGVPADGTVAPRLDRRHQSGLAGVGDCDRPAFPCRIDVGDWTAMAEQPTNDLDPATDE
jgi:hypothetical protein